MSCTIVCMDIVADTNIFLAIALDEPEKERIIEVTEGCRVHAPEILPYEIGNALSAMVKRRQIPQDDVQTVFEITQEIPVSLAKIGIKQALSIAIANNIYAYDAYFLQCALMLNCPLLTLDQKLKDVAQVIHITVLE